MDKKIVQCVPNFSEGRDKEKIEKIIDCFRGKEGVKLLDYSSDPSHNRTVVTIAGQPIAIRDSVLEAAGVAKDLIDLTKHEGQHPRMGATDVIPFIPIKNMQDEEVLELARQTGEMLYTQHQIPVYFYERSATAPHRENLAAVRKGQFEGMAEKMKQPEWKPDFGEQPHPTAGVTGVAFRMPLVAFNVNLDTANLDIATKIGKKIRFVGGGLRYCKAMGVELEDRGITQVSMNMTDFNQTSLYFALELIKAEAKRYGVNVIGTEIIGLVPLKALIDCAEYYLQLEDFSLDQIIETRLSE